MIPVAGLPDRRRRPRPAQPDPRRGERPLPGARDDARARAAPSACRDRLPVRRARRAPCPGAGSPARQRRAGRSRARAGARLSGLHRLRRVPLPVCVGTRARRLRRHGTSSTAGSDRSRSRSPRTSSPTRSTSRGSTTRPRPRTSARRSGSARRRCSRWSPMTCRPFPSPPRTGVTTSSSTTRCRADRGCSGRSSIAGARSSEFSTSCWRTAPAAARRPATRAFAPVATCSGTASSTGIGRSSCSRA